MTTPIDLSKQVQRAMKRLAETRQANDQSRDIIINAIAETQQADGTEPDLDAIGEAVDQVLAETEVDVDVVKKKKPYHLWLLGGIIAIPFIVPVLRAAEALVAFLLRIVL